MADEAVVDLEEGQGELASLPPPPPLFWVKEIAEGRKAARALGARRIIQNAVFCKVRSGNRITPHMFILHTKDVDRFRNGTVHEFSFLKTCQISKVHARSYENENEPCTSSNYENPGKNLTTD